MCHLKQISVILIMTLRMQILLLNLMNRLVLCWSPIFVLKTARVDALLEDLASYQAATNLREKLIAHFIGSHTTGKT